MSKAKKISIFTSLILMILGIVLLFGAMCSVQFDFTKLSTTSFTTKSVAISEPFQNIKIQDTTGDIRFVPSNDNNCTVVYKEDESTTHSIFVKDGTLIIQKDDDKTLDFYVGIHFDQEEIVVSLPQAKYDSLTLDSAIGNVDISKGLTFANATLHTTSGNISFEAAVKENLSIATEIGNTSISEVNAKNIAVESTSGDIELSDSIAQNHIQIASTIGNIELTHCDAGSLDLSATSGDVYATLLSDKVFEVSSDSGEINIPMSNGDKKCSIATTIGNIDVEIDS